MIVHELSDGRASCVIGKHKQNRQKSKYTAQHNCAFIVRKCSSLFFHIVKIFFITDLVVGVDRVVVGVVRLVVVVVVCVVVVGVVLNVVVGVVGPPVVVATTHMYSTTKYFGIFGHGSSPE